jgi:hypothetical protein
VPRSDRLKLLNGGDGFREELVFSPKLFNDCLWSHVLDRPEARIRTF